MRTGDKSLACCVVWGALPGLTQLAPVVGHMGVTDSQGVVHDFAGPYTIHKGQMLCFGPVLKYVRVREGDVQLQGSGSFEEAWDEAVHAADAEFRTRMHYFLYSNCHSHAAHALNALGYRGSSRWHTYNLIPHLMLRSRFVSKKACLQTWAPLCVVLLAVLVLVVVLKSI